MTIKKPRLLLHACCGVCSAYVPELLIPDYDVTIHYENSNIYPPEEFKRRADAAREMAKRYNIAFIEVKQDEPSWYRAVQGHSQDKENGPRCEKCMRFRLDRAFAYAKENEFDIVACTLGVSRRKNINMVNGVGRVMSEKYGIPFLDRDWKKGGGEIESQRRAKESGIYRQEYCGCVYSKTGLGIRGAGSGKSSVETHYNTSVFGRGSRQTRREAISEKSDEKEQSGNKKVATRGAIIACLTVIIFFGAGCVRREPATSTPIGSALPSSFVSPENAPSMEWKTIGDGVDRGEQKILQGDWTARLILYRFDQSKYRFSIRNSETAKTVASWKAELADALCVINGVYFHEDNSPSGLLRIDGTDRSSRRFDADKSGLILFGDDLDIQDTAKQEFLIDSSQNSAQSYPFLINNGFSSVTEDSEKLGRRSFIGTDEDGRAYIGVFTDGEISLFKISRLLFSLPITWKNVLNLDGGASTSLACRVSDLQEVEPGYSKVPNVIVVEKK